MHKQVKIWHVQHERTKHSHITIKYIAASWQPVNDFMHGRTVYKTGMAMSDVLSITCFCTILSNCNPIHTQFCNSSHNRGLYNFCMRDTCAIQKETFPLWKASQLTLLGMSYFVFGHAIDSIVKYSSFLHYTIYGHAKVHAANRRKPVFHTQQTESRASCVIRK